MRNIVVKNFFIAVSFDLCSVEVVSAEWSLIRWEKMAYNVALILICEHWLFLQSYFKIIFTVTYICIIFPLIAYFALKHKHEQGHPTRK